MSLVWDLVTGLGPWVRGGGGGGGGCLELSLLLHINWLIVCVTSLDNQKIELCERVRSRLVRSSASQCPSDRPRSRERACTGKSDYLQYRKSRDNKKRYFL